jgi:Ca2+-transporting ATPase
LLLAPIHIAFLELVIDPACSVVFEAQPGNARLMHVPPRSPSESLISMPFVLLSLAQGSLVTLVTVGAYTWAIDMGIAIEETRALAFIVLVVANAALILPSRLPQSGWRETFTGLSAVGIWILLGTLASLLVVVAVPQVAAAFKFQPPSLQHGSAAALTGIAMLLLFQALKTGFNSVYGQNTRNRSQHT